MEETKLETRINLTFFLTGYMHLYITFYIHPSLQAALQMLNSRNAFSGLSPRAV